MKGYFGAALVAMAASVAAAPSLDFKGVQFGVGGAHDLYLVVAGRAGFAWDCVGAAMEGAHLSCTALNTTFANEPASSIYFSFDSGKLGSARITTTPESFPAMVAALSAKYGKPSSRKNSTVKTPMNAAYPQSVWTWNLKGRGSIIATLRDGRIDESSIFMISDESAALFAKKQAEEKTKQKPDI
jgi:hypothetical protein